MQTYSLVIVVLKKNQENIALMDLLCVILGSTGMGGNLDFSTENLWKCLKCVLNCVKFRGFIYFVSNLQGFSIPVFAF